MSISGVLSNALSGLTAASRAAEIVASNISNATTEGYAARSLSLSARMTGGVAIDGVSRAVNQSLLADRRMAEAEHGHTSDLAAAYKSIEDMFGSPMDAGSLSALSTAFETSLIEASSRPDSTARLGRAVQSADMLATKIRQISQGVQAMRTAADRSISQQVEQLNKDLEEMRVLNARIVSFTAQGVQTASLLDTRQGLIDRIAAVVPVKEVPRENGAVALFTSGGAILLDITAAKIGFSPVNLVTPHMTQAAGTQSGLTINSKPVSTDPDAGPLRGGRLDAAFQVRDGLTVAAQQQLDAMARNLVERFSEPGLDITLAAGQPGLLTDAGQVFDPLEETGLAGRITLNAALIPEQGGHVWRLRDGLGAPQPGHIGESAFLNRLADALTERRVPSSGQLGAGPLGFHEIASRVLSEVSTSRHFSEQRQSFASTRFTSLQMAERERGVDTDEQLQKLLQIEQAYAANARVIKAAGDMMDNLLRI